MLGLNWYKKHLKDIKQKARARYTPELNINLPISEIFDGISRTKNFYIAIRGKYGDLLREFRYITSKYEKVELQEAYHEIKKDADSLFKLIEEIKEYNTIHIPWNKIQELTSGLRDHLWKFSDLLRREKDQVKDIKLPSRVDGNYQPSPSEILNSDIHYIYKIQELIRYYEELSSSTKSQLSNHPFLLLTGSAGAGKTHLLCDVVEQRIKNKKDYLPAFLCFGEYFSNDKDFWNQVLEHLKLNNNIKTKETFLKKLDDLGKGACCRTLFVIDALNENITYAPNFWKNNLDGIIKDINKYPNIALILSVRNGFEKEVLTEEQKKLFIHEEHSGFRFREWEAVNRFFKAFKLPLPEIPLIMPEFQNPLFLLLFCKAFEKRQNTKDKQIFRGHEGATYIFETYIDSISKPIEKKFHIDSSPQGNIWDTVIKKIAEKMVTQNDDRIAEENLLSIIQTAHPTINPRKFIQSLESNMLIIKVPKYKNGERTDGFDIKFPFQKFSDHLIGRYIFKKYENEFGKPNKNLGSAKQYFSRRRKLGKFLSKSWNRGIIEALSIQCPEQLKGIEFFEVAPYLQNDQYLSQIIDESFIESLIWRNPKAFSTNGKNTLKFINQSIIKTESGHNQLLNAFLSVAPIPNHPFNSERLHQHLIKFSMAERDSWWSTFLHYQYGDRGAVDRLLQWSWSDQNYSHINDESIFLTCIALSWFLTTSNRFVRDKATRGLVCLLQNRVHLLPQLLNKFKNVKDTYVIERLFAVAYGCVLRDQNGIEKIKLLAEWFYENIFKDNNPPVHILLRDYARGVIEVALKRGAKIIINKQYINPPYKSTWPKNILSEDELMNKYYPEEFVKDKTKERGFFDIWSSVMSFGDFARYIIGTNSGSFEWSGRKLKNSEPNRKKMFEIFKKSLTKKHKELFEKATNPFFGVDISESYEPIKIIISDSKDKLNEIEKEQKIKETKIMQKAFIDFENSLSKPQKIYFEKEIKPYLNDRGSINDPLEKFDLKLAQRWIFNRVIELGYNPKLHGTFDNRVNRYIDVGRSEQKAERIGKKYQWIAYHEFIALVSDHFEFKGDSWNDSIKNYKGPWQPFIRDIDISIILQNDEHIKNTISFSKWIVKYGNYDAWEKSKLDVDWIKTNKDLPNPENIIQITDDNKKKWLMLEGFIKWEEKTPPEYKKYDLPIKEVWYMLKSYIVKKKDAKRFFAWAKKQNFRDRWMPESHSFYEVFLGEYPNSVAFEDLRGNYNIWTKEGGENQNLQIPVVVTDDSYLNEFTLDCSHTGSISIKLPCKWLVKKMNLKHKYLDGRFYNDNDDLVTIDTSIFEENIPSSLLINKKVILKYLNNNNYVILWTLLGEKQLIGGSSSREAFVGRLDISGCYTLDNEGKIYGENHTMFYKH